MLMQLFFSKSKCNDFLKPGLHTEARFYGLFELDLKHAKQEVVIKNPFLYVIMFNLTHRQ
jgi:hypothetical protein